MKGFVHVVEIVVVGLVIFVAVLQLTTLTINVADWSRTKNTLLAGDILFSLDALGVDWFNRTQVSHWIGNVTAGSNLVYGLRLENAVKPTIAVGCNCTQAEFILIKTLYLQPFSVNGRWTTFTVERVHNFSLAYDVIIVGSGVGGSNRLSPFEPAVRSYLASGRGIVEFRTFTEAAITGDPVQTSLFGLQWDSRLSPNANPLLFVTSIADPGSPFHGIYRYFYGLPFFEDNFSSGAPSWFVRSGTWTVNTNKEYESNAVDGLGLTTISSAETSANKTVRAVTKMLGDGGEQQSFVVFSYLSPDEFYYASADAKNDEWAIGYYLDDQDPETTDFADLKSEADGIGTNVYYDLIVDVNDQIVTLSANGSVKVSNTFTGLPVGEAGLAVNNSHAVFDGFRITHRPEHQFSSALFSSGPRAEKVNAVGTAQAVLNQTGSNAPALIMNAGMVENTGRTAWLSYNYIAETPSLLRSVVVWAAGDDVDLIPLPVANPASASLFKVYHQDFFELVKITLTLGAPF